MKYRPYINGETAVEALPEEGVLLSVEQTSIIDGMLHSSGLGNGEFKIEEFWSAVDQLETHLRINYVRMDFGVPGLLPPQVGLNHHRVSLIEGVIPSQYPPYSGIPGLSAAVAQFLLDRLKVNSKPDDVFVTCGATHALFVAQAFASKLDAAKQAVVFLTPNYPPICSQAKFFDLDVRTIELDGLRGDALLERINQALGKSDVTALCWASPNNPSWTMLDDYELAGIAAMCKEYGVLPIEDLTYLGMETSGKGPLPNGFPSIARHAEDYFLVLSASKMLSYAGERVGFLVGSPTLLNKNLPALKDPFGCVSVRRACSSFIFNMTGGTSHSGQYAVAAMLDAVNQKKLDLDKTLIQYAERAKAVKELLIENGFYLVYSSSTKEDNGFYVNFGYPGMSGVEVVKALLYLGITVLPLSIFYSDRTDGVRACVARLSDDKLCLLEQRLRHF